MITEVLDRKMGLKPDVDLKLRHHFFTCDLVQVERVWSEKQAFIWLDRDRISQTGTSVGLAAVRRGDQIVLTEVRQGHELPAGSEYSSVRTLGRELVLEVLGDEYVGRDQKRVVSVHVLERRSSAIEGPGHLVAQ